MFVASYIRSFLLKSAVWIKSKQGFNSTVNRLVNTTCQLNSWHVVLTSQLNSSHSSVNCTSSAGYCSAESFWLQYMHDPNSFHIHLFIIMSWWAWWGLFIFYFFKEISADPGQLVNRWRPSSNVRALVNTGSRLLRGAYREKWRRQNGVASAPDRSANYTKICS